MHGRHRVVVIALTMAWLVVPMLAQAEPDPAEQEAVLAADIAAFKSWVRDYGRGAIRLVKNDRTDDEAIAKIDAMMAKMAEWNTLEAAKMLFKAAAIEPVAPGKKTSTEMVDFQRELQPWKVRAIAAKHLRAMDGEGILPWLLKKLSASGIRSSKRNKDQVQAAAVLRILAGHKSIEARLELLRACHSMPSHLRVRAVNAMARDATLDLAPTLIGLLRDSEPNVRIAAANSIGMALGPHTDETLGKDPTGETLEARDLAITQLEKIVVRDKVWQARSAAAFALASLKCKAAIPSLIQGLDAELKRKKDPWAMDVRLHKLLEGLTGQTVVQGSIKPWREFWKREGASFAVRPKTADGAKPKTEDRYEKFFDLEIESDRVLFVLDFSGSMAEPVQLQGKGTGASPGAPTTKAEIIVRELKKMVLGFPDGALLNLVVFSEDVRIWRAEGSKPALVKLDDEARDDLLGSFLDNLHPAGPTNLHDALATALDFGGRALYDKHYSAGFDTIYVISDGAPTVGPVTDKKEIRRLVRETNQLRKLAIHCVTFGDKNDTGFLAAMAEENGGRHIHIE